MKESSVCYLIKANKVLMLYRNKKINDVNHGKWIGIGGKKEKNESILQCAKREIYEESGYQAIKLQRKGIIDFIYGQQEAERIHVFLCADFIGHEIICDEGDLAWILLDEVESLNLWAGDRYFLPHIFKKDCPYFHYVMHYDELGVLKDVKEIICANQLL